ncbi:hypothetical protein [Halorussus sp. AFM4]|uniref:hypothetical protein n=1 Tax=Halorussus sp. AFM4 TaxID=3421651 RepID=UPI003EBEBFF6
MPDSRLARLAPKGRAELLGEIANELVDLRPDLDDPILAARHLVCRSAPDLVGLQPDGRAVYYWQHAEFASTVPFDDEDVYGGESEIFARQDGVLEAALNREYVWVHPDYQDATTN